MEGRGWSQGFRLCPLALEHWQVVTCSSDLAAAQEWDGVRRSLKVYREHLKEILSCACHLPERKDAFPLSAVTTTACTRASETPLTSLTFSTPTSSCCVSSCSANAGKPICPSRPLHELWCQSCILETYDETNWKWSWETEAGKRHIFADWVLEKA